MMRHTANINDPSRLKRIYSLQSFESDALQNSVPTTGHHFGLLIEDGPDQTGEFFISFGTHSVPYGRPFGSAVFVCPYKVENSLTFYLAADQTGGNRSEALSIDPEGGYERFICAVLGTARSMPQRLPMDPFRLAHFE
jgi:hypothetical protein